MGRIKLYIDYLKNYLKKKTTPKTLSIDLEEIKEETWKADFSMPEESRFAEEKGDGYEAFFEKYNSKDVFSLDLKRKHLFAWTINPFFRYKDFVLEASIILPEFSIQKKESNAGSCACGFIFRHISDKAFYVLLVSDKKWIRLDAVVNSTPIPVLGWTKPLESIDGNECKIKLICAGTSITVIVNNSWLGKFDSDIVQAAGKIGFAAQNWEDYSSAKFYLTEFKITSFPIEVETIDSVANTPKAIMPDAYINLASTYYAMGQYVSAIYQLKQAWKLREPQLQEHILAGRIYFAQRLTEEAEIEFRKAYELDNENTEVISELAALYYHLHDIKKLKETLKKLSTEKIKSSVLLCSLKAHLLSAEEKNAEAAKMYAQAFKLEPKNGLLKYNEGNELIKAGDTEKACDAYIQAANLFLASEEYKDMADTVNILERILPDDERTWTISGKFHYALENTDEALYNFKKLCKAKTKDSTIWYLYGLLVEDEKEAVKAFKKACTLNPDYGLYQFRLAETLYLNGEDCSKPLATAEELEPENGWVHNLKGLCAMDNNDLQLAQTEIEKARKLLPDEIVILENYVEIMRLQGRLGECQNLFEIEKGTADLAAERNRAEAFHIFANALFFDGRYEDADTWYQKALKLKPSDTGILTDKAENSLQIGLLNEADDLLVKALDIEPSERIYRLIASVSMQKGDYIRAEVTLKKTLEEFGQSDDVLFDLANLYLNTNRKDKAAEIIKQLKDCQNKQIPETLKQNLKNKL